MATSEQVGAKNGVRPVEPYRLLVIGHSTGDIEYIPSEDDHATAALIARPYEELPGPLALMAAREHKRALGQLARERYPSSLAPLPPAMTSDIRPLCEGGTRRVNL